jgi:maleate cis-trans isomerase
MYGRKGRIGLIVLDSDLTIEPDLRRLLPEGVELHTARVVYPRRVTKESLAIASEGRDCRRRTIASDPTVRDRLGLH